MGSGVSSAPLRTSDLALDLRGLGSEIELLPNRDAAADADRDAAFQRFHDALVEHFAPEAMLEMVVVVTWTSRPDQACRGAMRARRIDDSRRQQHPVHPGGDDPASAPGQQDEAIERFRKPSNRRGSRQ
jgi:hypothetical protein